MLLAGVQGGVSEVSAWPVAHAQHTLKSLHFVNICGDHVSLPLMPGGLQRGLSVFTQW